MYYISGKSWKQVYKMEKPTEIWGGVEVNSSNINVVVSCSNGHLSKKKSESVLYSMQQKCFTGSNTVFVYAMSSK